MGKKYKRYCDGCGKYYEGYGKQFCSYQCGDKHGGRSHKKTSDPTSVQTPLEAPPQESISQAYTDDSGIIDINSLSINTLEGALLAAKVDKDRWDVDRHIINSWQVTLKDNEREIVTKTNWQVKVWLKSRVIVPLEVALKNLVAKLPLAHKPKPIIPKPSAVCAEMAIVDVHFGKRAWDAETGRGDYDLSIAVENYRKVIHENLAHITHYKPEKVIFILGQDLMHIENRTATTPKGGNVLDVGDTRLAKVYESAMEAVIRGVAACRELAPVEVLWIPGNHDIHASMFLAYAIKEHFHNDPFTTVDVTPMTRKARLYGNLLVGWTHEIGNKETAWANELAQAFPKLWGKSKFREWHYGHKHKKQDTKVRPVSTQGGVMLRQLTALSPIDLWHYENLFTDAVPGGEMLLWSKDVGVIANFTAWIGG